MTLRHTIISALLIATATFTAATTFIAVGTFTAVAQEAPEGLTAGKCLAEAPTTIFSLIDNNTRLDMLDYFHAGVDRASANSVGGECFITAESPYSVSLQGGEGVQYQLFVLNPTAPAPIIGVVETISTPVPDSKVTFYNSRWQKVPTALIPEPRLSDWLTPDGSKRRVQVEESLPFILASYSYDPDAQILTVANNMHQYYIPSDTPEALKFTKDKLVYRWDGKFFKALKK